jgi:hypothetical protein
MKGIVGLLLLVVVSAARGQKLFLLGTGKAKLLSHTEGVCNPSYLAIGADARHVYACTESRMAGRGSVSAFELDRNGDSLRFINKVSGGGDNLAYVSVDSGGPTGRLDSIQRIAAHPGRRADPFEGSSGRSGAASKSHCPRMCG